MSHLFTYDVIKPGRSGHGLTSHSLVLLGIYWRKSSLVQWGWSAGIPLAGSAEVLGRRTCIAYPSSQCRNHHHEALCGCCILWASSVPINQHAWLKVDCVYFPIDYSKENCSGHPQVNDVVSFIWFASCGCFVARQVGSVMWKVLDMKSTHVFSSSGLVVLWDTCMLSVYLGALALRRHWNPWSVTYVGSLSSKAHWSSHHYFVTLALCSCLSFLTVLLVLPWWGSAQSKKSVYVCVYCVVCRVTISTWTFHPHRTRRTPLAVRRSIPVPSVQRTTLIWPRFKCMSWIASRKSSMLPPLLLVLEVMLRPNGYPYLHSAVLAFMRLPTPVPCDRYCTTRWCWMSWQIRHQFWFPRTEECEFASTRVLRSNPTAGSVSPHR